MKGSVMTGTDRVKRKLDEGPDEPLFRVGEIWTYRKFCKRFGGDRRTIMRMRKAGLKVWKPGKKGLVLIDSLAGLIMANAPLPAADKPDRRKPKKRR
jgi:hypothetical protein